MYALWISFFYDMIDMDVSVVARTCLNFTSQSEKSTNKYESSPFITQYLGSTGTDRAMS